jgi:hypothetical protein
VAEPRRAGWLSWLWTRLALAAVLGLVAGLAVSLIGTVTEADADPVLCAGIGIAAAVLVQLVRETAAEPEGPQAAPSQFVPDRSEYFARLRQLERRLEAASRDGSKYDRNVRPVLARLAADRLRQKYGIDAGRQPDRAREVLGDQLWSLMVERPEQASPAPSQAQLSALVDAIEAL